MFSKSKFLDNLCSSKQVETETDVSLLQAINKIENDIKKKDAPSYINLVSTQLDGRNRALTDRVNTDGSESAHTRKLENPISHNFKTLQRYDLSQLRKHEEVIMPQKGTF